MEVAEYFGGSLFDELLSVISSVVVVGPIRSVVDGLDVCRRGRLFRRGLGDRVYSLSESYVEFICFGGQFGELELGLVDEMVSNFLRQLTKEDCAGEEVRLVLLRVKRQDLLEEVGGAEDPLNVGAGVKNVPYAMLI